MSQSVRFLLTLALGFCGGWLFDRAGLPLPWMLGSLSAVTLSALLRVPVFAPPKIRPPMTAIIGVLLGAGFHPGLIDQVAGWLPSFLGLIVSSVVAGCACSIYLSRVAGLDRVTAYFAGMPGGLIEMVEIGRERGGAETTIALMHASRIFLIVMTVPFLVQIVEGVSIAASPPIGPSVTEAPLSTFWELIACAVAGSLLGSILRLPARHLLGPMLVSAALHLSGATTFVPPTEIVQGAQLVLGAVLGSRFTAATPREVRRILCIAAGMSVVLISTTVGAAFVVAAVTGFGPSTLVLAYSPGGLTEMGLMAIAIQADIAFVAAHHLFRVVFVMICADPAFQLLERLRPERVRKPAA
ncbi:MAG: AbrB family transcriptional regulator [Pseudomonadota bacterium]